MKNDHIQFGVHENTASTRQHASRPVKDSRSTSICIKDDNPDTRGASPWVKTPATDLDHRTHAESRIATTGGKRTDQSRLLNVHEVAELLQVRPSWVYGRMRKRSFARIPAYRVGKYWRFKADEVMSWLQEAGRQSGPDHKV
jgi:excisionase family DNA binding protein